MGINSYMLLIPTISDVSGMKVPCQLSYTLIRFGGRALASDISPPYCSTPVPYHTNPARKTHQVIYSLGRNKRKGCYPRILRLKTKAPRHAAFASLIPASLLDATPPPLPPPPPPPPLRALGYSSGNTFLQYVATGLHRNRSTCIIVACDD